MLTDTQVQNLHKFPIPMLEALNLAQIDQDKIAEGYGYDWESIKDLPQYKAQSQQVADALISEGRITPFIAANALFVAVEKIAERVIDPKTTTGDLLKAADTLMKVKNDGKPEKSTSANVSGFNIQIILPGHSANNVTISSKNDITDVEYLDVSDFDAKGFFEVEHVGIPDEPSPVD